MGLLVNQIKNLRILQKQTIVYTKENKFLTKKKNPLKYKSKGFAKKAGRNNQGSITVRHQGGGVKQLYRVLDLKREFSKLSIVLNLEYDPNRSGYIARMRRLDSLSLQKTKKFYYILAPQFLKKGTLLGSNIKNKFIVGNSLPICQIPIGTFIYNIPLKIGSKGIFARSAGTFGQILKKINDLYSVVRLPSGEQRLVFGNCKVSIGIVSNHTHKNKKIQKAGRSRWLNKRPTVRGVAMNPIDHPHGGGEGKTSGGRPSVSLWGKYTKGIKTRKKYKINKMIISKRVKKLR